MQIQDLINKIKTNTATQKELEQLQMYYREYRRNNLEAYCLYMLEDINFNFAWFHKLIINEIQKCLNEKRGKLIIEMPPRHGKTLLAGLMTCSYCFGAFPEWCLIYATYNDKLASAHADLIRQFIQDPKYEALFDARIKWNDDTLDIKTKKTKKSTALEFNNTRSRRGSLIACGAGGTLTGKSGNLIIIDDYVKNDEEVKSLVGRDNIWKWYTKVAKTRREEDNIVIVFATRWHSDDLIGRLKRENLENSDPNYLPWKILNFEAQKTSETLDQEYDKRNIGDYLYTSSKWLELYADAKKDFYTWESLYQQHPIDDHAVHFQEETICWYSELPSNLRIWISVDPNRIVTNNSNYIGITVWGVLMGGVKNKYYLIDFEKIKINHAILKQKIFSDWKKYYNLYGNCSVLIETNVANNLYEDLREVLPNIYSVYSTQKKVDRSQGLFLAFSSGCVFLPVKQKKPNIYEFVRELKNFNGSPRGIDDLVDSSSQLIIHLDKTILHSSGKSNIKPNLLYKKHFGNATNLLSPYLRQNKLKWQK